ncbi:hypothetical protein C1N66_07700 [Bacillus cereus]|uniref:Uncharacterized protein n=1 Tax=Bacillus cereus TaxID=1396 RepID=A0AB73UG78_BACCE|nr:hypothetical protein [Bacillus cereus]QHV02374.1 hypothetical protein C1N82_02895 [Bacillus cereus]QHV43054.1 hypothetical protein C1N66_07700 [Bacillus cereus]
MPDGKYIEIAGSGHYPYQTLLFDLFKIMGCTPVWYGKIKCEYYMDIKKKGVRPYLNKDISTEDFLDYYWLKEEL